MMMDYIRSAICIIITSFLVVRYLKSNYQIVGLLFTAFALRYYSIPLIGPTIDVLYLFALFVSFLELAGFLSGKIKVSKSKLLLFLLPFVCFLMFLTIYGLQKNRYLNDYNPISWYIKTSTNYVKTFLPYFLVAIAVKRNVDKIDLQKLYKTIFGIAVISSLIAAIQLFCFVFFYQQSFLLEIIGLRGGYNYQYELGSISLVRVQAFFYEPKSLAAFLGLAIPVAFYLNKKKYALVFFVVGILTVSQTFFVILLAALVLFVLLKKVQSVRTSVFLAITIVIGFFFSVSHLKNYLLDRYASQEETIAYKLFWDRALQRYNLDNTDYEPELLGIPLQSDIELPAVSFFRDNNIFLLSGFGPGNYSLIPFKYFVSDWNISAIERGTFKGHFDMGWVYLISEFGLFFFVILVFCLTAIQSGHGFSNKFYSFLWLVFFFHRIDILVAVFFCLLFYKNYTLENINSNYIVQPG